MMISVQLKKTIFDWNYRLFAPVVRVIGWASVLTHLIFYFALHHDSADTTNFIGRMLVVALCLPLTVFPQRAWTIGHKIYFEFMLAFTMPAYFTYMLLNATTLYWAVTLIFVVIYYGVFSRWQFVIWLYPLSVAAAFWVTSLVHPEVTVEVKQVMNIQYIAVLALVLVQVLKTFVEASHLTMVRLKEKADQQNEIFSALLDISVEVSRFDDLDEIFHLLLKRFETIFPDRGFGLLVEGPRPKIIPYMAFRGVSQKDTTFLLQVHPYVLGFASVSLENDEETLSSIEGEDWQVFGGGIRSTSIQGQTVYCFKLFVKGRSLDEDERRTLEVFLETIRGMTRSRIQALELERYSNTDQLTGLYNRNYFNRILDEWKDKARPEKPFSVIFGDINGLKRINDTYGHQAGDMMIKSSANLLSQAVRNSDLVFRLGGDEVVILCPSTTLAHAQELVKRICMGMETLIVPCVDEISGNITEERVHISFGAACSTEKGPEEVITLADKRMFEEKNIFYSVPGRERYR
jgi:diguanylate cyclase (GGDEF)-like protein